LNQCPLFNPDNIEPDSKTIEESNLHSTKQLSFKTSTDKGIMISTNAVSRNASFSIRDNLDPDSNISEVSDSH
jgi:hypothetical protein